MEIKEDEFWHLIDLANQNFEAFTLRLQEKNKEELESFVWQFQDFAGDLEEDEFIDCILEGVETISDDGLEDLSGWIVGKGKAFYEKVVDDPECIPYEIDDDAPGIEIQYEASKVYAEKFGMDVPSN